MTKLEMDVAIMRAAGLSFDEIEKLDALKRKVGKGECDELTMEHKRHVFGKYLAEHGANESEIGGQAVDITRIPDSLPDLTSTPPSLNR